MQLTLFKTDVQVLLRLCKGESLVSCTERVVVHELIDYLEGRLKDAETNN